VWVKPLFAIWWRYAWNMEGPPSEPLRKEAGTGGKQ
jgi:hypothetical protein